MHPCSKPLSTNIQRFVQTLGFGITEGNAIWDSNILIWCGLSNFHIFHIEIATILTIFLSLYSKSYSNICNSICVHIWYWYVIVVTIESKEKREEYATYGYSLNYFMVVAHWPIRVQLWPVWSGCKSLITLPFQTGQSWTLIGQRASTIK